MCFFRSRILKSIADKTVDARMEILSLFAAVEIRPVNKKLIGGPKTEEAYIAAWNLYINENRDHYVMYIDLCGKAEDFNGHGVDIDGEMVDDWFMTCYGGQYDSTKRAAKLTSIPAPKKMNAEERASFQYLRIGDDVEKLPRGKVNAFKGIVSVFILRVLGSLALRE